MPLFIYWCYILLFFLINKNINDEFFLRLLITPVLAYQWGQSFYTWSDNLSNIRIGIIEVVLHVSSWFIVVPLFLPNSLISNKIYSNRWSTVIDTEYGGHQLMMICVSCNKNQSVQTTKRMRRPWIAKNINEQTEVVDVFSRIY